jgi:transposase
MAQNFLSCDRDQVLLLPPDLSEWLPAGHLARFVIEAVDQLDLSEIYAYYRQDGHGRPAHDPAMMVALVLYSYACGVRSSRAIERRCVEDVASRVIAANRKPDHSTIANFLVRHREPLSELFFQVLALCRRAGMVKVGTVAVDSTKLAANASAEQNRTLEALREEAGRIIEQAIETDRREDELYGEARGDELPEELADPRSRKARIRELLEQAEREREQIESERAALVAEHQRHHAETGRRKTGRPPNPEPNHKQREKLAKKYNLTDPDSGVVRHRGMLMQGYNVQSAVGEGQVILAARAVGSPADQDQLAATVKQAQANLERIEISDAIKEVLADSGYWNLTQVRELTRNGVRVLVPPPPLRTGSHAKPDTLEMIERINSPEGKERYRHRQQIVEPVFAHIKHIRGITRVLRRGRAAVQAEIDLIATTHNLLKLHTTLRAQAIA